ncbi:MAG: ABC transporter [Actinobacteria bacterium]|nr:ABC transporter [Actinomycetota bacterium]
MSDHEVSKPSPAHDVADAAPVDAPAAEAHAAAAQDIAEAASAPVATEVVPDGDASGPAEGAAVADGGQPAVPADHAAVAQSANEGLAEAARAAESATTPASPEAPAPAGGKPAVDPDLAAFEAAEAAYPGTFGGTFTPPSPATPAVIAAGTATDTTVLEADTTRVDTAVAEAPTQVLAPAASTAFAPPAADAPLPIFVQAPEPPRERGNRGAIFGIGLLAAIAFAILYLGTALGIDAISGNVTADGIGAYLLDQVRSGGLWIPVAVFAIGFWLLGAIINRGRWGFWVVFGIIVGAFAYGGHLLGAIGSVEFWKLSGSQLAETVNGQLLAPLAIGAFVFGRELTIWFGAWAARTGRRRTAQNEEAQREYERVLEAGPQLPQ